MSSPSIAFPQLGVGVAKMSPDIEQTLRSACMMSSPIFARCSRIAAPSSASVRRDRSSLVRAGAAIEPHRREAALDDQGHRSVWESVPAVVRDYEARGAGVQVLRGDSRGASRGGWPGDGPPENARSTSVAARSSASRGWRRRRDFGALLVFYGGTRDRTFAPS